MSIPRAYHLLLTVVASLIMLAWMGEASAQAATPSVAQFFTVDPEDKSAALLAQVFGPDVWETINGVYSPQTMDHTGNRNDADQSGVIGAISLVLNLGCMLLTVIIILWGAVSANLQGALEGTDANRRYNMFWTPLRSVYSFGLLLPVIGGYSLIQVIILKLLLISIGIANAGYTIVTDRVFQGRASSPVMRPQVDDVVQNMMLVSLCQLAIRDEEGRPLTGASDIIVGSMPPEETYTGILGAIQSLAISDEEKAYNRYASQSFDGLTGSNYSQGVCGSWSFTQKSGGAFSVEAAEAAATQLFQDRLAATNKLKADMDKAAAALYAHVTPSTNGTLPSATVAPAATDPTAVTNYGEALALYRQARDSYRSTLLDASRVAAATMTRDDVRKAMELTGKDASEAASKATEEIQAGGWLMTGAIYWNLSAMTKSINEVSGTLTTSVLPPNTDQLDSRKHVDKQTYESLRSAFETLHGSVRDDVAYKEASGEARAYLSAHGKIADDPGAIDTLWNQARSKAPNLTDVDKQVIEFLMQEGDFVSSLVNIGNYCWNIGWTTVGLSLTSAVTGVGAEAVGKLAGRAGDAIGTFIGGLASGLATLFMTIAVPFILMGFFLAFYLPMIPLILWSINICSWIIATVKTFIAAPIWAAAHSIPEGEGIAGQHAKLGYMMILGILLRPLLLVIGLIAGAVILQVVGWFLRYTLPMMFSSFDTSGATGFMGFIGVLLITTSLCITLAVKCFSLSYEIADEILEWIGGGVKPLGDGESMHRMQGLATGVMANQGASAIGGLANNAMKSRQDKISSNKASAAETAKEERLLGAINGSKGRSNHVAG